MYKIIFPLFIVTLLNAEVYNGVAVVVKDKAITLFEIQHEMEISKLSANRARDILIRQKLEEAEIDDRKIKVSSAEVYDDIKKLAARNNMSISDFYDAVRESNGMNSMELKAKTKQKLLSQKLYQAIAYSSLSEPSDFECEEYYDIHKDTYKHPASFTVIIYDADNENELQTKVDNPMFYSPKIRTNEQLLPYDKISPELASLLERTALNSFTNVIPNGKGGFMSFYIKEIESAKEGGLSSVRTQIVNSIMSEKREQVLSDYFARLKHNADINIIREVN
ncbi:peptidyl-prolyl cis-trans isomerase [Sulfurimonas sp. SAG-AH-194-C20]|nr:peptidyl-prolyl cis-trans isomerase [Sulfurimonas sp. SAG-AH-194-C20]MDF1878157.1 peptidyl-prolyl cis-trans isomerase [Sulfurimonas sp. SAG-AH-194-C20]